MLRNDDPLYYALKMKKAKKQKNIQAMQDIEKVREHKIEQQAELENRLVIKNNSVLRLCSVRSIFVTLIVLASLASIIANVVLLIKEKDTNIQALYIVILIAVFLGTLLVIAIVYNIFEYLICKRNEDIDYMNEHLKYCEMFIKKNKKK